MKYDAIGFDVDGTLIINIDYCWDAFHERFGVAASIRQKLRHDYMMGEITYTEWGRKDVSIWRKLGISRSDFDRAISEFRLVDGAIETLRTLKKVGLKLFTISGSLDIIVEKVLPDYATLFDYSSFARIIFNQSGVPLDFDPGHPSRLQREDKAVELREVCNRFDVDPEKVAFVGDNDNDVPAVKAAGLGIAFCPKTPRLRNVANATITEPNLRLILPHVLGKA